MKTEVHRVCIQLARPRGDYPGKVGYGDYIVKDDTVYLVDSNGSPIDRVQFARKLNAGDEARAVACALTRRRLSKVSAGFNRALHYPPVVL